jgi:long-chain acyl-CoA synthetase
MFAKGFVETFIETAGRKPDAPAIEMLNPGAGLQAVWTYGELLILAERYRGALESLGVAEGDRILVQLPAGPGFVACLHATVSLKAVFTSVSPHLTDHELQTILGDLKPYGAIATAVQAHQLTKAETAVRFLLLTEQVPAGLRSNDAIRVLSLSDIPNGTSKLIEPNGNPIVTCHYTYKGLGLPLGVLHRYEDYKWCTVGATHRYGKPKGGHRHLAGLPLYSTFGLVVQLIAPMSVGAHLYIAPSLFEIDVIDVLGRYQIQFASIVPLLAERLSLGAARKRKRMPFHPELKIISGGSHMTAELLERLSQGLEVDVFQGYGLTETLPITGTFPDHNRPGSIGLPLLEEFEIAIVDNDGAEVGAGRAGHIVYRGPTLMDGFLNKPDWTERFKQYGWFNTGDLGYKDNDGFLHYLGRSYPISKVASHMVDLLEVESVLERHPGVSRARVTAHRRPGLGETLLGSVIPKGNIQLTESELRKWCLRYISNFKTPREFRVAG